MYLCKRLHQISYKVNTNILEKCVVYAQAILMDTLLSLRRKSQNNIERTVSIQDSGSALLVGCIILR